MLDGKHRGGGQSDDETSAYSQNDISCKVYVGHQASFKQTSCLLAMKQLTYQLLQGERFNRSLNHNHSL